MPPPLTSTARGPQICDVEICERNRFRVGGRISGNAVAREGEIARRQDAAFCIVDVHVLDVGKVADHARQHDIDLVLNSACMTAVANAQEAAALVSAKWNEQDCSALVDQMAGHLGKFRIVADHHPDRTAVGIDDFCAGSALDVPPIGF